MIGIGITTRNRPEVLEWSLKHFDLFKSFNVAKGVVIDDNSDEDKRILNEEICQRYGFEYQYNTERTGIAAAKNRCVRNLADAEFLFLFDDDCFPRAPEWDLAFIEPSRKTNICHMMYITELPTDNIHTIEYENSDYKVFAQCFGVCLFFTKECFDVLNGYDEGYGIYGYEHADVSQRAWKAGFCKELNGYYVPAKASEAIFSLDIDYCCLGERTCFGELPFEFKSSLNGEPISKYITSSNLHFSKKRIF